MNIKYGFSLLVVFCLIFFTGCVRMPPKNGTAIDRIHDTLNQGVAADSQIAKQGYGRNIPISINQALIPAVNMNLGTSPINTTRHFNISVHNIPAKQFFMGLVKNTSQNIVVSPDVKGNISLDLKNITVKEALDAVRDIYGYQYRRTAYGYNVFPRELATRIFTVNYLDVIRKGKTITKVHGGQPTSTGSTATTSNGSTVIGNNQNSESTTTSSIETKSDNDFWKTLKVTLETIIGDEGGRKVVVEPQAGLVVVRAYPNELKQVAYYLGSIQNNLNRQVILDAKILEVKLKNGFQQGVNWNLLGFKLQGDVYRDGNLSGDADNLIGNLNTAFNNNIFNLHISTGDFFSIIKLLSTEGNVQILSSPRISTVNNQKAVIKVGSDEYFVTGLSTLTVGGSVNSDNSQDVQLTPFFSGIALDVTPQIDRNGDVILHIHPSVSKVIDQQKRIDLGVRVLNLPLAFSSIRESDTIVRSRSGQVIIIGGLMEDDTAEQVGSMPWFSKLPFVGTVFRDVGQESNRSELVILLKATVVNNGVWPNQLANTRERYNQLQRGFHFGGHPEVFGTMAEKKPYWERYHSSYLNYK